MSAPFFPPKPNAYIIWLTHRLGTLIAKDPGYVLVTYDGHSIQTSFWIGVGLIGALVLSFYLLLQCVAFVLNMPGIMQRWSGERKAARAVQLTNKQAA